MRIYIVILIAGISVLLPWSLNAQSPASLFQPYTWEQASLLAARENKLVLVEVGEVDRKIEKSILGHRELLNYLQHNVVAIRMDVDHGAGQEFKAKLLMYPYPTFAFFMPYGDLLEVVQPDVVGRNPEVLREVFEAAKSKAEVKRSNSRSVHFVDIPFKMALEQAGKQEKQVFVEIYRDNCQACLLMEKNVYNLDRVADFYNRDFVSLRLNADYIPEFIRKYEATEYPGYLYLNREGKALYFACGKATAGQLLEYGRAALEKAKGIVFDTLAPEDAMKKAQQEKKLIFTDMFTLGGAHKEMLRTVYADPEVTDLFTDRFVNISREADQPALIFLDATGRELHRLTEVADAADLLKEAQRVLQGQGVVGLKARYDAGERDADFMEDYIRVLFRAGNKEASSKVALEYLLAKSPEILKEAKYWELFVRYILAADDRYFDYVLIHRKELAELYGEKAVGHKIAALWIAGAENFVREGVFDEDGFKEYTKRLKKEKVEGWRSIVRNARMNAAARTGNWKTYVELAEERWNEEQVADAELYSWGLLIRDHCQDEATRYKAARWFALAAGQMERKERISGKVNLSSYKGFFEKLVSDLLKNE